MPRAHERTPDKVKKVTALAQRGVPQDLIGIAIGTDKKTLEKHYRAELDAGRAHCIENLLTMAFERAKTSDAILIFLLKTKAGLRETGPVPGEEVKPTKTITFRVTGRGERITVDRDDSDDDDE